MFHVDLTFEDQRIILASDDGAVYRGIIADSLSGRAMSTVLTSLQLSYIFAINMDKDGTPQGHEAMYEVLEPLFVNSPQELRPIP
jgi:hypothetical protein